MKQRPPKHILWQADNSTPHPPKYQVLIPGTCKQYLIWKKKVFVDMIKFNIKKQKNYLHGINTKCSYKKEAEGDLAHRGEGDMKTAQREI